MSSSPCPLHIFKGHFGFLWGILLEVLWEDMFQRGFSFYWVCFREKREKTWATRKCWRVRKETRERRVKNEESLLGPCWFLGKEGIAWSQSNIYLRGRLSNILFIVLVHSCLFLFVCLFFDTYLDHSTSWLLLVVH